jgi:hypothetical protein
MLVLCSIEQIQSVLATTLPIFDEISVVSRKVVKTSNSHNRDARQRTQRLPIE